MEELNQNIKAIQELKDLKFFVEDYQRGYKWGIQQVEELLNDILEFEGGFESFYCLQPVVVKDLQNSEFELIDGQQRLTTIYIILNCLGIHNYDLSYRTRTGSEEFLKEIKQLLGATTLDVTQSLDKIQDELNSKWVTFISVNSQYDNIDNYHFFSTYHFVNAWLSHINDKKNFFKKNLIEKTKVIWYEQESEEDAESIFVKFNRGKIDLAQAELIKALFVLQLNQEKNIELRTFKLNQFAEEWNSIENELQDDAFWFFVSNDISDRRKSNRIDLLFDLITEKPKNSNNNLFSYHLYLKQYSEHKKESSKPELNWSTVRDLFNQLFEWYQDRLLYHLIGFIVYQQIKTVAELNTLFNTSNDKIGFVNALKKIIKDFFYSKDNKDKFDLESISYGSDNSQITSWLVLHNVVNYYLTDNYYRFPFDQLKLERGWSLEHIHAQKTDKLQSKSELLDWIADIEKLAEDFAKEDAFDDTTLKALKNILEDDSIQRDEKEVKELEATLNDEVSTYFQKDSIRNLCLLDRKTNSSIGNKYFSEKRREILNIDRASLEEYNKTYKKDELVKPFIPLATKHVFLKYFTKETEIQMSLWGVNDREHYLGHIKSSINQFLETTN